MIAESQMSLFSGTDSKVLLPMLGLRLTQADQIEWAIAGHHECHRHRSASVEASHAREWWYPVGGLSFRAGIRLG